MIGPTLVKIEAFVPVEESWKGNEVQRIEKPWAKIVQTRGWKKPANGEIKVNWTQQLISKLKVAGLASSFETQRGWLRLVSHRR